MPVPEGAAPLLTLLLLALTVLSPIVAWRTRAFAAPGVMGPVRFSLHDTLGRFFGILLLTIAVWILAGSAINPLLAHSFTTPLQRQLAAGMLAEGVAFIALLVASATLREDGLRLIGMLPKDAPRGFLSGLAGLAIVLPWLFWLMLIAGAIHNRLNPQAPTEHEIFRLWQSKQTSHAFRIVSLFSAVVIAPLAEEAIFRGIIQTALTRLFTRRPPGSAGFPVIFPPDSPIVPPLAPPSIPPDAPPPAGFPPLFPEVPPAAVGPVAPPVPVAAAPAPGRTARWLAIIITSILFASIHRPVFIQPAIFALSIGLGYVYERTGLLWSSIFMHLLFNAFQFTLFLLLVG